MLFKMTRVLGVAAACLLCACGGGGGGGGQNKEAEHAEPEGEKKVDPVTACNAVQDASDVPVGCSFTQIDGHPHMVLGVPDRETLEAEISSMVEYLAIPFCQQNASSERAGVIFVVGKYARRLDCATAKVSDWIEVNPDAASAL